MAFRQNHDDTDAQRIELVTVRRHNGCTHRVGRSYRRILEEFGIIQSRAVTAVELDKQLPSEQLGQATLTT
jgi:hypothetical protein